MHLFSPLPGGVLKFIIGTLVVSAGCRKFTFSTSSISSGASLGSSAVNKDSHLKSDSGEKLCNRQSYFTFELGKNKACNGLYHLTKSNPLPAMTLASSFFLLLVISPPTNHWKRNLNTARSILISIIL